MKALRAVRRAWYSLVALLESFIRMEHLFEYMFMALGYLLGSHLATWGVLGILFEVIFAPWGHPCGLEFLLLRAQVVHKGMDSMDLMAPMGPRAPWTRPGAPPLGPMSQI